MVDYTVPAMEVSLPEVRQTFETNVFSAIAMCKTFLPLLIQAQGTIVQVGSIAGVRVSQAGRMIGTEANVSRSSRMCLDPSTTRPRPLCTPGVIVYVLNWRHLGNASVLYGGQYSTRLTVPGST